MAARKKSARKKAARKVARKKVVARKPVRKKAARKKAAKEYGLGGIVDKILGREKSEKKPKKEPKKEPKKKPAKPMRMSSLYNEERRSKNMLKKGGQGRRGMSTQEKSDYKGKYDAHKAANPDLYRGPGGALDSWWKKRNPIEEKKAPAPFKVSGGDAPKRPEPMASTQAAAVAAGSAPKRKSFVPEPAPSSQPFKIAPQKPQITHDDVSRPPTAQDIAQMVGGKIRPISTGVVNRQKPKRRSGRFGPGSPMGGVGRR